MRRAKVFVDKKEAGTLMQTKDGQFTFEYLKDYKGQPVSLTLPIQDSSYHFAQMHPFFEGLLPEGLILETLLKKYKIDRHDLFSQLVLVGSDLVGNVTIEEFK